MGTVFFPPNIIPWFDKYFVKCYMHTLPIFTTYQIGLWKVYIFPETINIKKYFPYMPNLPQNEIWFCQLCDKNRILFLNMCLLTTLWRSKYIAYLHFCKYTIMSISYGNNTNIVSYVITSSNKSLFENYMTQLRLSD